MDIHRRLLIRVTSRCSKGSSSNGRKLKYLNSENFRSLIGEYRKAKTYKSASDKLDKLDTPSIRDD